MKKRNITVTALKFTEKALRGKVRNDYDQWPPYCNGIFHQPKRPVKN